MCVSSPPCRITAAQAGQRLDVVVGLLFPDYSARARRRLWDSHRVLVNGKARPCGFMVREGDEICTCPLAETPLVQLTQRQPFQLWLAGEQPPHIVAEQQNLLFIYKPSGLHTAHLAGRGGPSLEAQLPDLLSDSVPARPPVGHARVQVSEHPESAELLAESQAGSLPTGHLVKQADMADGASPSARAAQGVRLVNRLDCGTSGLVVAAKDALCAAQWQGMENAGLCEKHYLTLLCGRLQESIVVRNDLDVDSRRVTKVLPTESTNPLRHSRFTPVGTLSAAALHVLRAVLGTPSREPSLWPAPPLGRQHIVYTVALCTIAKGARHQIRAHACHAGFPLWGDSLYAPTRQNSPDTPDAHDTSASPAAQDPHTVPAANHHFLLHHGRLVMAGAVIQCLPVWFSLLPPDIQAAIQDAWPTPL